MRRILRYLASALVLVLLVALALLYAGNALHWQREPPYEHIASWGAHGSGPGELDEPTGIAVHGAEVFVSDARNARIQVFDTEGGLRGSFGQGTLTRPMNLALAGDALYVADYFDDAIHVFALDGTHLESITAEDGLDSPGGVAVKADGTLLVADTYAHRIVHLARDGSVLRSWGTPGEPGRGAARFRYPTDVALAEDGGFYAADGYNHRVQRFAPDGAYRGRWGGPFGSGLPGPANGWFTTATSVAVSRGGEAVFVADFFNQRVQKFTTAGRFRTAFGQAVDGPLPGPIAVAVDEHGDVFVASFGAHRIGRWRAAHICRNKCRYGSLTRKRSFRLRRLT